jgi:hypothetical protein
MGEHPIRVAAPDRILQARPATGWRSRHESMSKRVRCRAKGGGEALRHVFALATGVFTIAYVSLYLVGGGSDHNTIGIDDFSVEPARQRGPAR